VKCGIKCLENIIYIFLKILVLINYNLFQFIKSKIFVGNDCTGLRAVYVATDHNDKPNLTNCTFTDMYIILWFNKFTDFNKKILKLEFQ